MTSASDLNDTTRDHAAGGSADGASPDDGETGDRRAEALAERLFEATIGALELFSIHIGRQLGLYRALADAGPGGLTAAELASRSGIDTRYAVEWLEQQAVAGLIDHRDGGSARSGQDQPPRRFSLPAGHDDVLISPESPAHVSPLAELVAGIGAVLPALTDAYRSGRGIAYSDYGPAFRRGQAAINRPAFVHELAGWFTALPDVADRLDRPGARIADVACGEGWSTVALARRFPLARIDGFDSDPGSIEAAREHVVEQGLDGSMVGFHLVPGEQLDGPYDLVLVFEALHAFARPVEVLRSLRDALAPGGCVLVADERVADRFTAPGDAVERLMYGWSVTHCLPAAMAEQPSAALGTVLRAATVHELAGEAGFDSSAELPIDNDFFRFYRLDP